MTKKWGLGMLTKLAARQTDPIRRQALGLAVQLPENVAEARAVLDQTREVLESFMVPTPREVLNRPGIALERAGWLMHECALAWTLGGLLLLGPIAAATARLFDCETASGWVLLAGVVAVSLVFGQLYGVVFSIGAGLAHNLLTVPPIFEFQLPSRYEVVRLIGCVLLSIWLPLMANAAQRLRSLALTGRSRAFESP
jgi:hypothetical protein